MHLIEIEKLSFSHQSKWVFDGLSLAIPRGKITGILGPSGTGKTTLLRLIGGQLRAQQGRVLFDGVDISGLNRRQLFQLRQRMGMLFQSGALFSDLSVYDNVALPLREHTQLPESFIRDLVLMKLQAVGLRGVQQRMPSELSGGMARRAALARAIALDPELIMYDEPFAGQDPIAMAVVQQLIKQLNDNMGLTTILVSHDVKETSEIADYLYLIAEQHVVAHGTPEQLLANQDPKVRQFLQGLADGPVGFHYPAPALDSDFLGA